MIFRFLVIDLILFPLIVVVRNYVNANGKNEKFPGILSEFQVIDFLKMLKFSLQNDLVTEHFDHVTIHSNYLMIVCRRNEVHCESTGLSVHPSSPITNGIESQISCPISVVFHFAAS